MWKIWVQSGLKLLCNASQRFRNAFTIFGPFKKAFTSGINPFQSKVAFHIETSQLIYSTNQLTGLYMKSNTGQKWVKKKKLFNIFVILEVAATLKISRNPLQKNSGARKRPYRGLLLVKWQFLPEACSRLLYAYIKTYINSFYIKNTNNRIISFQNMRICGYILITLIFVINLNSLCTSVSTDVPSTTRRKQEKTAFFCLFQNL